MAIYSVERSTSLGAFLLSKAGVQQWRISYLVRFRAVRVMRNQALLPLTGPEARLQDGDIVQVDDPLPGACARAFAAIPAADYRDYALVPGTTPFDRQMVGLMDHRPQTIRIRSPLVNSLAGFVLALTSDAAITNPVRHLIVASHAHPEGYLFLRLSMGDAAVVTYEDLETAAKHGSLKIESRLLEPRPRDSAGRPVAATLLIRGCRIGSTLPYLRKLKEALGNTITVIAPKHFHSAAQQSRPAGFVEYMGYSFTVNRPRSFRNQAEAITAFSGGGFTRIDDRPVPARLWSQWIPSRNVSAPGQRTMPARILSPITGAPESIPGFFRYRRRTLLTREGSVALASDPGSEAGRRRVVRSELVRQFPRFRDTHPFPEYVRLGYPTMDEFMSGWTWTFRYDTRSRALYYNAARHEYTVMQPIVEPASNRLFLNFYPSGRRGSVIEQIAASDARFFSAV